MSRIVPLCIFCRIRKSSCVRAITSTIALPIPSTSKRVAIMEGAPSAQTAGTIAIGTASSVLFPQPCGLSSLAPHDEVARDDFRELLGGAAQWLESLHPQLGATSLRRKRRIGGDGELLDNWARGTCRGDETEPYFGREIGQPRFRQCRQIRGDVRAFGGSRGETHETAGLHMRHHR